MPFLLLDLGPARYCDGYYFHVSDASRALSYHRECWPASRFVMCEVRHEADRPPYETMLPNVADERLRLSDTTEAA